MILRGRQTKSCNFTEILKAKKLKNSHCPSSNKTFYYFAPFSFGIAEYNDRPINEQKISENGRKFRKMKSIVLDLSEKIMACMDKSRNHCGKKRQEDHDGPISLTWELNSTG